jgi:hypothetical protein
MTREVVGTEPAPGPATPPVVEFDLGELSRLADELPPPPRDPITLRLRHWHTTAWSATAVAVIAAVLAGLAGWHLGGDRRQHALEDAQVAHPAIFGWVVDGGPNLASGPDDARANVSLHVANLSPDPIRIESVSLTTDLSNASVRLDGYARDQIAPQDNTIAQLVARATCTSEYQGAFLSVLLTQYASDGTQRPIRISVGADGRIGDTLGSVLDRVCVNPTQDDPQSGVDGLVIDQTSGASGATVTITNHSNGLRQVQITSDESPAFQLVSSVPEERLLSPGDVLEIRLQVRVVHCNAIVGLKDWAASIALDILRRGQSLEASTATDVETGFGLPDLMLVPGGAAIQKTCSG